MLTVLVCLFMVRVSGWTMLLARGDAAKDAGIRFKLLLRDLDTKLPAASGAVFAAGWDAMINTPVRSRRAGIFAGWCVGMLRATVSITCWSPGWPHQRKVLARYARHYNDHRPHPGLQHTLRQSPPDAPIRPFWAQPPR